MTVFTYYLEIFFNFSQDMARSAFMATIVLASTSDGRMFASLMMLCFLPFPNDCIKCAVCSFGPSLQEQIDNFFFYKI